MDNKNNTQQENGEIQVVTLEDSSGDEIVFEVIATVDYNEKEYIVLLPMEEYGDDDEYTILEIITSKDGKINEFLGISDYNVLTAVYKKFCAEYEEE